MPCIYGSYYECAIKLKDYTCSRVQLPNSGVLSSFHLILARSAALQHPVKVDDERDSLECEQSINNKTTREMKAATGLVSAVWTLSSLGLSRGLFSDHGKMPERGLQTETGVVRPGEDGEKANNMLTEPIEADHLLSSEEDGSDELRNHGPGHHPHPHHWATTIIIPTTITQICESQPWLSDDFRVLIFWVEQCVQRQFLMIHIAFSVRQAHQ